jgi:uncharacterized membrane protein YdcZ (DUF606 family)
VTGGLARGARWALISPLDIGAWVLALSIGAGASVQAFLMAEGSQRLGADRAAFVMFGIGLLIAATWSIISRRARWGAVRLVADLRARRLPWWAVMGGLGGALFVLSQGLAVEPLGVAVFGMTFLAGQVIGAILLDALGATGMRRRPTAARLAGAGLAITGAAIGAAGLGDAQNQADFEAEYGYPLAPPTTWEEYTDVAKFFTRDTDGDGEIDLYGTDVKGGVETEWLATVSQAGAEQMVLDPASGEVTIDSAEHLEALDFYTSLLPYAPPGAAQLDWPGAQNLFYQGQLAMMRFWGHAYTQTPDDAVVKGNIGAAPMIAGPGGIAGVPGAWYLSVPTAGTHKDAAKDFIAFAYEHNDLSVDTSLGLVARISAFESQAGVEGHENYGAILETLNSPATKARPATAKWNEIVNTVLTPLLQKAVEPGADNAALLKEAKGQIEAIIG